jgi:ribonuclease HIII
VLPQIARAVAQMTAGLAPATLHATAIDYGARLDATAPDGAVAKGVIYFSRRKDRYTLTLEDSSDPGLAERVRHAAIKACGPRLKGAEPKQETLPRVGAPLSGIPQVDDHLASVLPRLHAVGIFPDDMQPIPYGLKLVFGEGKHRSVVSLYYSKKKGLSVVAGKGKGQMGAEDIARLLRGEPELPANEAKLERWIGTDEAGKGDYFGPLVTAGVLLDRATCEEVVALGATDSKQLDDARLLAIAGRLRGLLGPNAAVVAVNPVRYNQLYADLRRRGRKLNDLVAWTHGRAVADLQERDLAFDAVVVDRFASTALIRRHMPGGVKVLARPKAEDNPAVAAASILARARYLDRLASLTEEFGVTMRPGAGDPVIRAGRELVDRHGAGVLEKVGKHHFRTTETILGR